jgi:hypothetical protein
VSDERVNGQQNTAAVVSCRHMEAHTRIFQTEGELKRGGISQSGLESLNALTNTELKYTALNTLSANQNTLANTGAHRCMGIFATKFAQGWSDKD